MNYLFDSNLCIAIINGTETALAKSMLRQRGTAGDQFFVPTIVVHELWYGIAKSQQVSRNILNLKEFLTGPFTVLDFGVEDARLAGEIRAALAVRGTPIGPYDVLIAGQALARDLTLVTANTREFARVSGLKLVDWS